MAPSFFRFLTPYTHVVIIFNYYIFIKRWGFAVNVVSGTIVPTAML